MICAGVCSGISAPAVAWDGMGWDWAFESEIEPFPSAVLKYHRPDVPNHGDMNKFRKWPDETVDLIIGGTPCQSFSIAGLRQGMDDPRGNLALTFIAMVERYAPRWVVWENVPGVFSSSNGRDFESFIRGMAEIGYFGAWRVLDAQWFGVAQRRRRVFAVFCIGNWRPAAAVLFEPESLRGDSAPSREAGEELAPSLAARTRGGGGLGTDSELDGALIPQTCGALNTANGKTRPGDTLQCASAGHMIAFGGNNTRGSIEIATAVNAHGGPCGRLDFDSETFIAHSLSAEGFDASEDGTGRGTPLVPVAFDSRQDCISSMEQFGALGSSHPQAQAVAFTVHGTDKTIKAVRRLTPRECERLQGFPDHFTAIPWRGKAADKCPDGPRYKALGNSMAVPVVRWIGERIQLWTREAV